jgi:glycosyltransferase involved in cell wall biosynthesis
MVSSLKLENDVIWLGAVDHAAVWEWMYLADVFLITNDVTNRCNPLYEAICAGLPIVSVRDPSTADLLEHGTNALLADRDDIEQLGKNLYDICTNEAVAKAIGDSQAKRAQHLWSWEERMKVEVEELEGIVNGTPGVASVPSSS